MKVKFRSGNRFNDAELKRMLTIYQGSYTCTWEEFLEKKETIDLYATYVDNEEIVGFTGLCYKKIEVDGKRYMALYVGQTAIPSAYRGKSLIQRTIIKLLFKHYTSHPFTTLLIWNNAVTYRPYLILSKGLKDYYPNTENEANTHYKNIQNKLGEIYYLKYYNPETGLVIKDVNVMKAHEVNYTQKELSDAHIRYYLDRNPGSAQGHGLISFCIGSMENLSFYLKKKMAKKRTGNSKAIPISEAIAEKKKEVAEQATPL